MDKIINTREKIKSEFRYYLTNIARSARRTSEGINLGKTAVDSFLSFIETQRLFDYNPEKWSHIKSMYDITKPAEVKKIADSLLNDNSFLSHDTNNNQGWRSGAISHYVCFINARSFFKNQTDDTKTSYESIKQPLQQIFYGAPGTGKSNTIKREVDDKGLPNIRTTFHPDTDYSTFVGAYKPTTIEVPIMTMVGTKALPVENPDGTPRKEKKIVYEFVPQAFLKAYTSAWKDQDKPFFLIIEEINRGNCAQIFGDLFQLLDRKNGESEYPISPDEDIQKFLQTDLKFGFAALTDEKKAAIPNEVLTGELMILPKNLHIWATMNTSDQSLFPIDSAFKRRWDWKYIPIKEGDEEWHVTVGGKEYDWWSFVNKMNSVVGEATSSEDKKMGFYFCKAKDKKIDANTFVSKVVFYLWNDVFKDNGLDWTLDGKAVFKYKEKNENGTEKEKELTFASFFNINGSANESQVARLMENLGVEALDTEIVNDKDKEEDIDDIERNGREKSKPLCVTLDGVKIQESKSISTFAKVIEAIGVERVADLGLTVGRAAYPLLSKNKLPEDTPGGYGEAMRQIGDYWMVCKFSNDYKEKYLNKMKETFGLNMEIAFIDK